MPWVYQVQDVKTEKKFGETYVLVHFWPDRPSFAASKPPAIVESFVIQLRPRHRRIVTDKDGRTLRESGYWASPNALNFTADPPVYEEYEADVTGEIKDTIERFLKRHHHVRGNLSDPSIKTDTSDPRGILAKPDVAELTGKDFDETRAARGNI
ncbi:MAG: hypothetical protein ACYTEX_27160 [Planctomycetota bacterium]|jgi:hypothetical protein